MVSVGDPSTFSWMKEYAVRCCAVLPLAFFGPGRSLGRAQRTPNEGWGLGGSTGLFCALPQPYSPFSALPVTGTSRLAHHRILSVPPRVVFSVAFHATFFHSHPQKCIEGLR